jgi:16S rRNA (uracil1498-N3)-methyltransferase
MSKKPLRVPVGRLEEGSLLLDEEASHYVARVHRLRPGDTVVLFDPEQALEADATLEAVDRGAVRCAASALRHASVRPMRRVTLLQAVCKGDKFDAVVRDATELGATRIVPVLAERSVVKPGDGRAERWRRIAVEAARQCGRGDAPAIASPLELGEAVQLYASGEGVAGLCLDPTADRGLGAALSALGPEVEVAFVVGPEGGLTPAEVEACVAAGVTRASMGPLVLRAETVCAAVLGALLAVGR